MQRVVRSLCTVTLEFMGSRCRLYVYLNPARWTERDHASASVAHSLSGNVPACLSSLLALRTAPPIFFGRSKQCSRSFISIRFFTILAGLNCSKYFLRPEAVLLASSMGVPHSLESSQYTMQTRDTQPYTCMKLGFTQHIGYRHTLSREGSTPLPIINGKSYVCYVLWDKVFVVQHQTLIESVKRGFLMFECLNVVKGSTGVCHYNSSTITVSM